MRHRLHELAQRREALVALAAQQRASLSAENVRFAGDSLAGRAYQLAGVLKAHPVWVVAAAVVCGIVLARRGRLVRWAGRAWMLWRGWQAAQLWLRVPPARR